MRHIHDNEQGFNSHVVSYAATNLPIVLKIKHKQHTTVMDAFDAILRALFQVKGSAKSNLSSRATLVVDRGYLLLSQFKWWLETGGLT